MKTSSPFSGKNVLITGGLGLIGSSLAQELLKLGANITLVDSLIPQYGGNIFNIAAIKDKVHFNISDVRDSFAMAHLLKGKDYLFNMAGQTSHLDSMQDPLTDLNINVVSQLSILESCRQHNPSIKVIFASTRQIYGRPEYLPVDESHPICPVDINGVNKLAGETYHLLYNKIYGLRACALRLTNTYGPGMRVKDARQTFLGVWIKNLVEGKPVLVYGDGMQLRDFNYVEDVVDAFLLAAIDDRANGQIFNLGSLQVTNLNDLALTMIAIAGRGSYQLVPFPEDRKAIDIGDYYSDFSKIKNTLGWQPKISLEEGLSRTLDFYFKNHSHYWDS